MEALREAALAALGEYGDPVARGALERGSVTVERDVARWTSSEGEVHAHRIHLSVDAQTLARALASPAVGDSLHAALASAVARAPHESMASLELHWNGSIGADREGYRGAPAASDDGRAREALMTFLDAQHAEDAHAVVRTGAVTLQPGAAHVHTLSRDSLDESRCAVIESAARALFGSSTRVTFGSVR